MIFDNPPIHYGRIYCPQCTYKTHFVSWDENRRGPEDGECRECGFKYGVEIELVTDPHTGATIEVRKPVLDVEIVNKARAEMVREFMMGVRSLHQAAPPEAFGGAEDDEEEHEVRARVETVLSYEPRRSV
jgi:Zn ribbon nucleic-acid-binding protein